jgi:hypothetical protein
MMVHFLLFPRAIRLVLFQQRLLHTSLGPTSYRIASEQILTSGNAMCLYTDRVITVHELTSQVLKVVSMQMSVLWM